jgi:hypothetical protein
MKGIMFTPKDFDKSQVGNYMKFTDGANRVRILKEPITGYVYWKDVNGNVVGRNQMAGEGGKPFRVRDFSELGMAERGGMRGFAAMIVWNYQVNKIQILEIKQSGIMNSLEALSNSKSWGDVTGYDIVITRTKTGSDPKDVEYSVMPEPKAKLEKDVLNAYNESNIDLNALYEGTDPFGGESEDVKVNEIPF